MSNGRVSASLFLCASVSCGHSEAPSRYCWCVHVVFLLDPSWNLRAQFATIFSCEGGEGIWMLAGTLAFPFILNSLGPHTVTGDGKDGACEFLAL